MKIEGENAYPVYGISMRWTQDGEHSEEYGSNHKGLRVGRTHNSNHIYIMFKEEQTDKQLRNKALTTFNIWAKNKGWGNPSRLKTEIELYHHETWCLTWFSHYTFDTGQSDEEVLRSFNHFVDRMEKQNYENGHGRTEQYDLNNKSPFYCLMGAEDNWRWSGANDDNGDRTEAPCRCDGCKKHGLIRINH